MKFWVTFIADTENDVVKIGVSKSPKIRLKQLQISNSNKLTLLGYMEGSELEEKYLHKLFGKFKLSGEWFVLNDIITDYINSVNLLNIEVYRLDKKVYCLSKMKK